ncbi:MAG: alpha-ketoacid dehydrogenase subunit beta [Anaerolineales bacterium]|jgi:pyruvate dehydrogenase E1 component beta subunit|nr:alpha-ketoacid dehydrogenase subunit beta [Anaerolineales bacterium]
MPTITYSQALNDALREEMRADPRVFVMGEDIGAYGGVFRVTKDLLAEFGPQRVIDTPISEAGFVGLAVGAAMMGMRPVVELMFMDFALVAADQILNQAAKMRYMSGGKVSVPMVIRAQQGGGRGNGAQHSQSFEAWFAHTPGLKVVAPSTPYDAKGLLKSAIRDGNPIMFIEHKLLYNTKGEVPESDYHIPLGKADVKRVGRDITLVSYSRSLLHTLEAAETLSQRGIEAEVIDLRTIEPLDMHTILESIRGTARLLVIHEAHSNCGVGAEIIARVYEQAPDALVTPARRLGAKHVPIPVAEPLENAVLPQPADIVRLVEEMM